LYYTYDTRDQIVAMTPSGQFTEYTDPSGQVGRNITEGPDGALYYTYDSSPMIGRLTPP
jgi:streptogramin lyase